jgi:hypothetical protein
VGTVTTENTGKQEANKPNPNEVALGLLEKLGIPNPPPVSTVSAAVGVTEVAGRATDVQKPQPEGLPAEVVAHSSDVEKPQLPTPAVATAQTLEVDCRPCNGCCGGRRGRRLPRRVYGLVGWVAGVRGVPMCQVLNEYPELFCQRLRGRSRHGLNHVKELERLLSREGEYKASYVLGRLNECLNDAVCWRYLRLGVEGWYRVVHLLADREPGDVDAYFAGLVRGLGFGSVVEASRYLRLVVQGLLELRFVNRGRGYHDALSARCRLCGVEFDLTGPLPAVLFNIVRHFRVEHRLARPEDVEAVVEDVRESQGKVDVVLRSLRSIEALMGWLADGVKARGLVSDGKCTLCGGEVGGDPLHVVLHFVDWHREVAEDLFRNLGQQQVREPQAVDLFEDVAREVSQRTGVEYELVLGVVKTVYSIVNIEGTLNVDEVIMHMNFYDPALTTRLTGIDVRHLVLAVKEALDARGLIDARVKAKPEEQPEAKPESEPEEPHSSEQSDANAEAKAEAKPEESQSLEAKAEDKPPEAECRPEDIGANSIDPYSITHRLACELYRLYGKPGNYITLAEMLIKDIKKDCSEKALERLGYGNVRMLIKALKKLKLC